VAGAVIVGSVTSVAVSDESPEPQPDAASTTTATAAVASIALPVCPLMRFIFLVANGAARKGRPIHNIRSANFYLRADRHEVEVLPNGRTGLVDLHHDHT
jgi:hypothetical protein